MAQYQFCRDRSKIRSCIAPITPHAPWLVRHLHTSCSGECEDDQSLISSHGVRRGGTSFKAWSSCCTGSMRGVGVQISAAHTPSVDMAQSKGNTRLIPIDISTHPAATCSGRPPEGQPATRHVENGNRDEPLALCLISLSHPDMFKVDQDGVRVLLS